MPRFVIARISGGKGAVWLEELAYARHKRKIIPNERGGDDEVGDAPLIWNLCSSARRIDRGG